MKANHSQPLPCLCATLRRASRALTQRYEDALRPVGLKASQFTILQVLALAGEVSQGELAEILAMDSTTLTRTLAVLGRHAWVTKRPGQDRREWRLRLAKAGAAKLQEALPHWERAQREFRDGFGSRWESLMENMNEVTNAAIERGVVR